MGVRYFHGKRSKWVPAGLVKEQLRPSTGNRPPRSRIGVLKVQQHKFYNTEWVGYHVELNKGYLQWWETEAKAKKGHKPEGWLYLLGLQVEVEGLNFLMRTTTTSGAVYTFQAESQKDAETWYSALFEHETFCESKREESEREAAKKKTAD